YGTTENAVKTQIWIAISVYLLVAIVKKRLNIETSLYTILQILSLTLLEKTPIDQLLKNTEMQMITRQNNNQLNLFN
ncbi:MAG: IS4 family transposase, partial [Nitrosomonas sp.]|nr:IS4 family transposase [Nitrosomonas sp.]